jgi:hypothetical protein
LFITRRDASGGGWSAPALLSGTASEFAPEQGFQTGGLPFGAARSFVRKTGVGAARVPVRVCELAKLHGQPPAGVAPVVSLKDYAALAEVAC